MQMHGLMSSSINYDRGLDGADIISGGSIISEADTRDPFPGAHVAARGNEVARSLG